MRGENASEENRAQAHLEYAGHGRPRQAAAGDAVFVQSHHRKRARSVGTIRRNLQRRRADIRR